MPIETSRHDFFPTLWQQGKMREFFDLAFGVDECGSEQIERPVIDRVA
jgi:hypothetical protein